MERRSKVASDSSSDPYFFPVLLWLLSCFFPLSEVISIFRRNREEEGEEEC